MKERSSVFAICFLCFSLITFAAEKPECTGSLLPSPSLSLGTERTDTGPSPGRAFLYSFLVPGLGEAYAGSKTLSRVFISTETALWIAFACFRTLGRWHETDYRNYAVVHAGISLKGKDHDFFVDIEHFDNTREHNEARLRQRDPGGMYPETAEYQWKWDSRESRLQYEHLRISSDSAYNRALMMIGAVVFNHIASGIDALRIARNHPLNARVDLSPLPEGGAAFSMTLSW